MIFARGLLAVGMASLVAGGALLNCSSKSNGISCTSVNPDASFTQSASVCYPDNDGLTGGSYTIAIAVSDTGFLATGGDDAGGGAKNIIQTQNNAVVTLTLTNVGTTPHGFEVECTSVCPAYPDLPAGCSPVACFPPNSTIAPIAPDASTTITFDTPTPDGLLYPFKSSAPADSLNNGQWSLQ
jgi:hypothetical protein